MTALAVGVARLVTRRTELLVEGGRAPLGETPTDDFRAPGVVGRDAADVLGRLVLAAGVDQLALARAAKLLVALTRRLQARPEQSLEFPAVDHSSA